MTGRVKARPQSQVNSKMATGEVEVYATSLEVFNKADPLPIDFNQDNTEEQRLRYRYLDLRRPEMTQIFIKRAAVTRYVRRFLRSENKAQPAQGKIAGTDAPADAKRKED